MAESRLTGALSSTGLNLFPACAFSDTVVSRLCRGEAFSFQSCLDPEFDLRREHAPATHVGTTSRAKSGPPVSFA